MLALDATDAACRLVGKHPAVCTRSSVVVGGRKAVDARSTLWLEKNTAIDVLSVLTVKLVMCVHCSIAVGNAPLVNLSQAGNSRGSARALQGLRALQGMPVHIA
jgi:hypothetical protein